MVSGEDRYRGRPKEGGGHRPLKISLDAEIMKALEKVKKNGPISQFIEELIRPMARQFDPGPSSHVALEILNKITSERDEANKREDFEQVVALDFLLLKVRPVLGPFISMSEPDAGPPSKRKRAIARDETVASPKAKPLAESAFSEEYRKATLGGLYYALDYLIVEFDSVFSISKNVTDLKFVKVLRGAKYVDLRTALWAAGLISDEFDLISQHQFAHEMKERRDMVSRVLNSKHPGWMKEIQRPPDTRAPGLQLPDYLLLIDIDHTKEPYKANVVACMAPQFAVLAKNLSKVREMVEKLEGQYPELVEILHLLDRYNSFFEPGFRKCKEYEERNRLMKEGINEYLAKHPHGDVL